MIRVLIMHDNNYTKELQCMKSTVYRCKHNKKRQCFAELRIDQLDADKFTIFEYNKHSDECEAYKKESIINIRYHIANIYTAGITRFGTLKKHWRQMAFL